VYHRPPVEKQVSVSEVEPTFLRVSARLVWSHSKITEARCLWLQNVAHRALPTSSTAIVNESGRRDGFVERGAKPLKGFSDPVLAYECVWSA
jgi:hypothetical protein